MMIVSPRDFPQLMAEIPTPNAEAVVDNGVPASVLLSLGPPSQLPVSNGGGYDVKAPPPPLPKTQPSPSRLRIPTSTQGWEKDPKEARREKETLRRLCFKLASGLTLPTKGIVNSRYRKRIWPVRWR